MSGPGREPGRGKDINWVARRAVSPGHRGDLGGEESGIRLFLSEVPPSSSGPVWSGARQRLGLCHAPRAQARGVLHPRCRPPRQAPRGLRNNRGAPSGRRSSDGATLVVLGRSPGEEGGGGGRKRRRGSEEGGGGDAHAASAGEGRRKRARASEQRERLWRGTTRGPLGS